MERKDISMEMCLDVYRYCRLYREQIEDEVGAFVYFFVSEQLIGQRIRECKGSAEDWKRVMDELENEQDRWLRSHREEAARGQAPMKLLRQMIGFYKYYCKVGKII